MTVAVPVVIDLSSIATSAALHDALAAALGFPVWYGRNWDAFWDAITGLVDMPSTLRFVGWTAFAARLPRDAGLLRGLLDEMTAKRPALARQVQYV